MTPEMPCLEFPPPDPGLVDRIPQGLHAHKTENGSREQFVGGTPVPVSASPAVPDEPHLPTRPAAD